MADQSYSSLGTISSGAPANVHDTTVHQCGPTGNSFKVTQVGFICTVANYSALVVTVKRARTPTVTGNDVTIGTFPLPDAMTPGDVTRVSINTAGDTDLAPGEAVTFGTDGGGSAGTGTFFIAGYEYAEGPNPIVSFTTEDKPRSGIGDIEYAAFTES